MAHIGRRTLLALLGSLPLASAWSMTGSLFSPGIKQISGNVKINGVPARQDMAVSWGDSVETAAKSSIVFVIAGDAFLLRENSKVHLGAEAASRFIRLQTGKLLSVFSPGDKTIETQAVTLGIRGTGCYLEADPKGTYVCLCYGHAVLTPKATPDQSLRYQTGHHDSPYWIEGSAVSPGGMRNHSDAELAMLEALVGRTVPFDTKSTPNY